MSLAQALEAAGFPGVEEEGGVIFARLSAAGVEFRAEPAPGEAGGHVLVLAWPVRSTPEEIAAWNAAHGPSHLDIFRGETRLRLALPADAPDLPALLAQWQALSDEMIRLCADARRRQRARGEGM